MMQQLSLLDALHAPPIIRKVDKDGHVVQGKPHEVLKLPDPRLKRSQARIELHPHDGLWMWSTCVDTSLGGWSYRVGEKWGKFARTRDDALHYAIEELREWLAAREFRPADAARILAWTYTLEGT